MACFWNSGSWERSTGQVRAGSLGEKSQHSSLGDLSTSCPSGLLRGLLEALAVTASFIQLLPSLLGFAGSVFFPTGGPVPSPNCAFSFLLAQRAAFSVLGPPPPAVRPSPYTQHSTFPASRQPSPSLMCSTLLQPRLGLPGSWGAVPSRASSGTPPFRGHEPMAMWKGQMRLHGRRN